jgi:hypothetical protein
MTLCLVRTKSHYSLPGDHVARRRRVSKFSIYRIISMNLVSVHVLAAAPANGVCALPITEHRRGLPLTILRKPAGVRSLLVNNRWSIRVSAI